jgi:hypothetical protein
MLMGVFQSTFRRSRIIVCTVLLLSSAVNVRTFAQEASNQGEDPKHNSASRQMDDTGAYSNGITLVPASESLFPMGRWHSNWLNRTKQAPGPKTLLSWNGAETEETEADPRLVTDRPHFSEASSLVGLGRVQIETGYTVSADRSNGIRTITQSFGEPLLRAGIGAEWFEFRLASTALTETVFTAGDSRFTSGIDDIYIGAKVAISEQAGMLPEFAIFPQARLPSGSPAFTSDRFLPGVNLAYSWKLNDWLELECNTQFNSRRDDMAHTYTEMIQTVNAEYELADRLGGFTEFIAFMPSGSLSAIPEYYFHGGLVYFLSDNIQLDIHSGVGLNHAATDLAFTGVGLSWRY